MNGAIEAISAETSAVQTLPSAVTSAAGDGNSFASWFEAELGKTNTQISAADKAVADLVLGKTDNLHQVMITLEKAKLSFELMVEVRNKALEAYQEVMRMQI